MYKMLLVIVAAIVLAVPALGARYCAINDDCSDLGDIKCIFSMCPSEGICGCDRNTVAKWMGSTRLFQCVPLRKVGQRCSNINMTGACGAPNSFCNESRNKAGELEGWCECISGVPEHGGESCTSLNTLYDGIDGETCQADGTCNGGIVGSCRTASSQLFTPVIGHQYTCACSPTQKLILDYSASTPFKGRLEPKCVARVLGDKCRDDSECGFSNSQCLTGTCQCDAGFTKSYYGSYCIDNTIKLAFGGNCTLIQHQQLCDGAAGLVCGDECTWVTQTVRKCQCGRGHKESAVNPCAKIIMGDPCYGDRNCNVYNHLAICVDGACVDGSASIITDLKTLDDENAAGAMYVTWSLLAAAIISRFL